MINNNSTRKMDENRLKKEIAQLRISNWIPPNSKSFMFLQRNINFTLLEVYIASTILYNWHNCLLAQHKFQTTNYLGINVDWFLHIYEEIRNL